MKKNYLLITFLFLISSYTISSQTLFWTNQYQILSSELDNTNGGVVLNGNLLEYMRLDKINQKVYWSDSKSNALFSVNYDGSDIKTVVGNVGNPKGFCFMDGSIYIVAEKSIRRYDLSGNLLQIIIEDLSNPSDLEGDDGQLFWSDSKSGIVESIRTDGSERDTLVNISNGKVEIEIDAEENYLLYCFSSNDLNTGLYKTNYDGSVIQKLSGRLFVNLSLDAGTNTIYWLTEFDICKSSIDGPIFQNYIEPRPIYYPQLQVDAERNLLFQAPYYKEEIITKTPLDTNVLYEITVKSKLYNPYLIAGNRENSALYYVTGFKDGKGIFPDASINEVNIKEKISYELVSGPKLSTVVSAKYDKIHDKFYWFEMTDHTLYYSNSDGSNISEILETQNEHAHSLDIDPVTQRVFWHDHSQLSFYICDDDGQNYNLLKSQINNVSDLSYSSKYSKLFYVNWGTNSIEVMDVFTGIISTTFTGDLLNNPVKITLDETAEKIYFVKNNIKNILWRINYDGSGLEMLPIDNLDPSSNLLIVYYDKDLGTGTTSKETVDVYPSPFINTIYVSSNSSLNSMEIFDVNGKRKMNKMIKRSEEVDLATFNFQNGIYFVRITKDDGFSKTFRLVKIE